MSDLADTCDIKKAAKLQMKTKDIGRCIDYIGIGIKIPSILSTAEQGDNALGSVRPFIDLSFGVSIS